MLKKISDKSALLAEILKKNPSFFPPSRKASAKFLEKFRQVAKLLRISEKPSDLAEKFSDMLENFSAKSFLVFKTPRSLPPKKKTPHFLSETFRLQRKVLRITAKVSAKRENCSDFFWTLAPFFIGV